MRQFPLELRHVAPGRVVEWRLRSTAVPADADGGDPAGRRASFNQDKHFTVAEESRGADDPVASWLAITFEVEGALDEAALAQALLGFVRRHEVLRCEFRRLAGELACEPLAPRELALEAEHVASFDSAERLRTFLVERFKRSIDTLSWPLFTMGAVLRPDSATVYLAFDHIVCDGMSMPIVVREVMTAYEALRRGDEGDLPAVPSYLDFAEEQRRRYLSIEADDERLGYWKSFIDRNGEFFPASPWTWAWSRTGCTRSSTRPRRCWTRPRPRCSRRPVCRWARSRSWGCSVRSPSVCGTPEVRASTGGSCR